MLSDCSALTESLSGHNLIEDASVNVTVRDLASKYENPKDLAEELVRRGWLTAFQKELILAGKADELVLGKYVLLDKIGEGGMGAVYKARHRVLKAVRAIKVIRPDRLSGPAAVDRFYREAEVVAKLHHPNIILAHDADKHGNVHYFVMEYAPGADLGQLLQRCGPLPAADACAYIRQAALGLEHARERGLIHRDIKPSNLLVTMDGHVKLLDLGLARICAAEEETSSNAPLTQDGAVMGTPDYMAPEQAEDSRRVDIRADLYALGCTLYHVLTGRPPFPGGSVMEKLIKHRLEEPRPIEALRGDLPEGLGPIVRKMMAKNADQRFQTPAEVAAALEPFCGETAHPGLTGVTGLTHPPELAGTLIPGGIPGLPVGGLTVLPGSAMEHTEAGFRAEDAQTTTSPALRKLGSTERLSAGLEHTLLPSVGAAGRGRAPQGVPTGLQATQLLPPSVSGDSATVPYLKLPKRRSGGLVAAIVTVGCLAGGGFFLAAMFSPVHRDTDERRTEVQPATPPVTSAAKKDDKSDTTGAKKEPKEGAAQPQSQSQVEPKPPVVTPPSGPPAKAEAKALAGDRSDLASLRTRGPAVRTGGRSMSWVRRREFYALSPHKGRRAAFAADGSRAVFATPSDVLAACNLRDGQAVTTSLAELTGNLTDGVSHINALAVAPDGGRVLLATMGRSEKPLDGNPVTTRFNMLVSWEVSGTPELIYGPRIDLQPAFGCLAFSPDGKEVLVGGALSQIYRWKPGARDLRTSRSYYKHAAGDVVSSLAFSTDGALAASGGSDKLVCVYNPTKPGSAPITTLSGLQTGVASLAISPSGLHVLAGGRDGKVCLWDVGDAPPETITKPTQVLSWHDKDAIVTAAAFAPSGRFLTGSDDGTICLGEVGKDKPIWVEAPRPGGGAILALSVSADGRSVLVADEAGLGQYPLTRDVVAQSKAGAIPGDADAAPAEAKR
jgi:tRNA A-37 threonylcarbamoyl transferase component Bud32